MRFSDEQWLELPLGAICTGFGYGINAEAIDFDGENKYIRITDIDEESSKYISNPPVSPAITDSKCIVKENDILFARTGASTGKSYLYNWQDGLLYYAGFLIRANVKKSYNAYFVYQQTKTNKYNNWVRIMSARSGQPGINAQEFSQYKISFPSLPQQNKIASFLSKVDQRIETQSKIIDKLKSQIISISNTMVKSIAKKISIEEICDFEEKTKHQSGDGLASGTYPFFTNEEETVKFFDSYDFNGEYIIANTGGKANFKYYNGKFAVMSDCLVIKFKSPKLTNFYSIVLSTLQKYINYVGFEGSGLKHLNKDWLLKLQVPQYGSEAETFIKIIDELKEKLQKEKDILSLYKKQKAYLLANMFI